MLDKKPHFLLLTALSLTASWIQYQQLPLLPQEIATTWDWYLDVRHWHHTTSQGNTLPETRRDFADLAPHYSKSGRQFGLLAAKACLCCQTEKPSLATPEPARQVWPSPG